MKMLNVSHKSEILVPSYNCGAEIEPVVKRGAYVTLYIIKKNLTIDIDDLTKKIGPNTKAILITHYFGFPQPVEEIRDICDKNGLYLIEDCAHALFSTYCKKPLGSFGDVAIFSLKKMLPVSDGGILLLNNSTIPCKVQLRNPSFVYELKSNLMKLILQLIGINNRLILTGYGYVARILNANLVKGDNLFGKKSTLYSRWHNYRIDFGKLDWSLSHAAFSSLRKIIEENTIEKLINISRNNFQFLLGKLRDSRNASPLFMELQEGVCPSIFPLIVNDRDKKYGMLMREGIFCLRTWPLFYPGLPWDRFPISVFLKKHVISIPINHTTNEKLLHNAAEILSI